MVMNSLGLYNLSQNTVSQVSITTGLKAVGRPGFILVDKNIEPQTKKFSAMKELLYQITCLGIYLAMVPGFNKGAFKIAKKMFKDEKVFKLFDNPDEFEKIKDLKSEEKLREIDKLIKSKNLDLKKEDFKDGSALHLVKGVKEFSSILSSVIGLAIIAPIVSHPLIKPALKIIGLEENKKD